MSDSINPYESPATAAVVPESLPAPPEDMARVANGLRYIFIGAVIGAGNNAVYIAMATFATNAELLHANHKFSGLLSLITCILDAIGGLYCWATPATIRAGRLITIYSLAALAMIPLMAGMVLNYAEIIPSLPVAVAYTAWLFNGIMLASFLLYLLRLNGFLGQDRFVQRGEIVLMLAVARLTLPYTSVRDTETFRRFIAFPRIFLDDFTLLSYLIVKLVAALGWVAVIVIYAHLIHATRKAVLASGRPAGSREAAAADEAGSGRKEPD